MLEGSSLSPLRVKYPLPPCTAVGQRLDVVRSGFEQLSSPSLDAPIKGDLILLMGSTDFGVGHFFLSFSVRLRSSYAGVLGAFGFTSVLPHKRQVVRLKE